MKSSENDTRDVSHRCFIRSASLATVAWSFTAKVGMAETSQGSKDPDIASQWTLLVV
jgi:hypothetical protein